MQASSPSVNLEQVLSAAPCVLYQFLLDAKGKSRFIYLSPQCEGILGISREVLLADLWAKMSLMEESDIGELQRRMAESAQHLTPFELTFSLRQADGYKWISAHSLPVRQADGSTLWTGRFIDVTGQKRAELELFRSQSLLNAARQQAELGIWEYYLATGKIHWSPEVFRIHGVAQGEGEPDFAGLCQLWHPEDLPVLLKAVDRAIAVGEPYRFDLRIIRKDTGEERFVTATGGLLRNAHTMAPERLYGTVLDITHRKKVEVALTAARDAAESAARAKSNFLATMSHELRTPLNGIVGMTSLLRRSPLTPAQQEYCDTVHQSAEALLSVVNDILDWSRIESGRLDLESVPFAVEELIQSTMDILRPQAQAKKIGFRFVAPEQPLPHLAGDPARLRQVLLNLGANAVKFTASGEVSFAVEVLPAPEHLCALRYRITDTGIGITSRQMEKLFQRFSQADASTTRRFGGTGLGLAISKSLVECMGGQIGAESTPGVGSSFWFEVALPVVDVLVAPHSVLPTPAAARPLRVLVAEDNVVNQRLASIVLSMGGHESEIATNGLVALEKATAADYDLILMDCQMPELDGYEATRRIRRAVRRRIPIIGLTASALTDDRDECLAAGMDDYLPKPYRADQLLATIAKWTVPE